MVRSILVVAGVVLVLMSIAAVLLLALRAQRTASQSTGGLLLKLGLLCVVAGLGAITLLMIVSSLAATRFLSV